MEITWMMLLTVCPLVFLASLVDSIGGGGGLISLPAYLLAGLPAQMASGTNKFSACFGTLFATIKYARGGKMLLKPALLAVVGALPGSYVGAWLQCQMSEETVRAFMLVAIPVVAVLLLFKRGGEDSAEVKVMTRKLGVLCFLIGLGCGLYDGFFGPGTGTILIMLFTWIVGMDMVSASGSAKLVNLASNAAALATFLAAGQVLIPLAIPATVCSVVGGYLGARLALKKGAKLIRYVMLGVLALLILKLIFDFFKG
ncbi:MAG: sulfite exporter TauE/SafE family protein [Clostridia bacterium]